MADTTPRELAIFTALIALLLLLGLYPRPVLDTTQTAVQNLQQFTTVTTTVTTTDTASVSEVETGDWRLGIEDWRLETGERTTPAYPITPSPAQPITPSAQGGKTR